MGANAFETGDLGCLCGQEHERAGRNQDGRKGLVAAEVNHVLTADAAVDIAQPQIRCLAPQNGQHPCGAIETPDVNALAQKAEQNRTSAASCFEDWTRLSGELHAVELELALVRLLPVAPLVPLVVYQRPPGIVVIRVSHKYRSSIWVRPGRRLAPSSGKEQFLALRTNRQRTFK